MIWLGCSNRRLCPLGIISFFKPLFLHSIFLVSSSLPRCFSVYLLPHLPIPAFFFFTLFPFIPNSLFFFPSILPLCPAFSLPLILSPSVLISLLSIYSIHNLRPSGHSCKLSSPSVFFFLSLVSTNLSFLYFDDPLILFKQQKGKNSLTDVKIIVKNSILAFLQLVGPKMASGLRVEPKERWLWSKSKVYSMMTAIFLETSSGL